MKSHPLPLGPSPQENVALIREINELRREIKGLRHAASQASMASPVLQMRQSKDDALRGNTIPAKRATGVAASPGRGVGGAEETAALKREIGMLQELVVQLQQSLRDRWGLSGVCGEGKEGQGGVGWGGVVPAWFSRVCYRVSDDRGSDDVTVGEGGAKGREVIYCWDVRR